MALVLRKVALPGMNPGAPWRVMALGSDDDCELFDFFSDLAKSSPKSFKRIVAILKQATRSGPQFHNKEICKRLKGMGPGDFLEFKCKVKGGHGARVLGFLDEGQLIICSHGFSKKTDDTPSRELNRLKNAYQDYTRAKKENRIVLSED